MLLFINNYFNIIRQNTKVTNSNNKDNESKIIGKIISGRDKCGSNLWKVCFINKDNISNKNKNYSNLKSNQNIASYNINNEEDIVNSLNKYDEKENIIKCIHLNEIFDLFLWKL